MQNIPAATRANLLPDHKRKSGLRATDMETKSSVLRFGITATYVLLHSVGRHRTFIAPVTTVVCLQARLNRRTMLPAPRRSPPWHDLAPNPHQTRFLDFTYMLRSLIQLKMDQFCIQCRAPLLFVLILSNTFQLVSSSLVDFSCPAWLRAPPTSTFQVITFLPNLLVFLNSLVS